MQEIICLGYSDHDAHSEYRARQGITEGREGNSSRGDAIKLISTCKAKDQGTGRGYQRGEQA